MRDHHHAKDEEEPPEISGNRTKVALILLLASITFVSVGQSVAGSFAPAGSNVRNVVSGGGFARTGKSSYVPLLGSSYNSTESSSFRGSNSNTKHDSGGDGGGDESSAREGRSDDLQSSDNRQAISDDSDSPSQKNDRRIPKYNFGPKGKTTPELTDNQRQSSRGKAEPPDEQQLSKDDERISYRGSKTSTAPELSDNGQSQSSPRGKDDSSDGEQFQSLLKYTLPIYLLSPSSNLTARLPWGELNKVWNRTTQYEDLLEVARPIPSLPIEGDAADAGTGGDKVRRRTVVMIHCGPKTGSTTLRSACRNELERTCGVPKRANGHFPVGYMDESKLYPLIRRCANTSHFCAKEITMPPDVPAYDDVAFVHAFPFRQYDEWARSALKQQRDRGGVRGCEKAEEHLRRCEPSRMEIDFRKYGKAELSKFKEGVLRRMNERGERHVFVLYHHRELDEVLKRLSNVYNIPTLPGSDGKGKEARPEGTCDERLLEMFHDCFSSELMELT